MCLILPYMTAMPRLTAAVFRRASQRELAVRPWNCIRGVYGMRLKTGGDGRGGIRSCTRCRRTKPSRASPAGKTGESALLRARTAEAMIPATNFSTGGDPPYLGTLAPDGQAGQHPLPQHFDSAGVDLVATAIPWSWLYAIQRHRGNACSCGQTARPSI